MGKHSLKPCSYPATMQLMKKQTLFLAWERGMLVNTCGSFYTLQSSSLFNFEFTQPCEVDRAGINTFPLPCDKKGNMRIADLVIHVGEICLIMNVIL